MDTLLKGLFKTIFIDLDQIRHSDFRVFSKKKKIIFYFIIVLYVNQLGKYA